MCFQEIDTSALVAEIGFQADENEGRRWAKVKDFWVPLGKPDQLWKSFWWSVRGAYLVHHIFQRVGAVDGKANEEEISFGI